MVSAISTPRYAARLALFGLLALAFNLTPLFMNAADAETRTLRMYFGHSKESATITFKKNGKYIKSGLRKANRFLRDWRRKESTKMDPELLDLVWEVYQKSGSKKPIQVISGYRSPKTNRLLRRRGRKVAKTSQHTRGKALDFYFPDVSVKKLRELGLKAHRGGVGYYRGSFVHLDTGRVRHWPRMSRRQLSRVFPRGRTIHVPSNGKPLRGYKTALANLKKGLNADGSRRTTTVRRSLLARIFTGSGNDGDEAEGNTARGSKTPARVRRAAPKPVAKKPAVVAQKAAPKGPDPFATELTAVARKNAVEKAKRDAADKEAVEKKLREQEIEKLNEATEEITLASLDPSRIARPRLRPRPAEPDIAPSLTPATTPTAVPAIEPAATQLALAPATGPASGPQRLAPVGATELALATGRSAKGGESVLRPRADIPGAASPQPSNTVAQTASAPVASPAAKPVLRQQLAPAPQQVEQTGAEQTQVASLEPQNDPAKMAALKSRITQALTRQRLSPQSSAKTVPSLRDTIKLPVPTLSPPRPAPRDVAAVAPRLRPAGGDALSSTLPTPRRTGGFNKTPSNQAVASVSTGMGAPMRSELSLGDLDGRAVTRWAVTTSTRTGTLAALEAPDYRQGTMRAAPASIYTVGFAFNTSPLRADRFTGQALRRVAFARLGG
ncbi:MAG: DUF882 domain-containing protein [Pseudomonadota bacterium]